MLKACEYRNEETAAGAMETQRDEVALRTEKAAVRTDAALAKGMTGTLPEGRCMFCASLKNLHSCTNYTAVPGVIFCVQGRRNTFLPVLVILLLYYIPPNL